MKLTERIFESLGSWGNHPAIIELSNDGAARYKSARELKARIDEMGDFLNKCGVRKNHLAALFLENSLDFIAVFLALVEIGAKPVPINLSFRKIELDEIFSNADPDAVIAESHYMTAVKPYTGSRLVIERHDEKWHVHGPGKKRTNRNSEGIDDSIASINYTYRGYGYPLGALVPHGQYLQGAEAIVTGLKPEAGENMLVVLPFSYMFPLVGSLCVPLIYGMTSILSRTVNPVQIFNYIRTHGINIITAVPEIYELMFNLKDASIELPTLSVFVSGGSVLSEEHCMKIQQAFNVEILHGYGLTEFTPVSRNMRSEGRPGTIGPLCGGVECKIMPDGNNGTGEIAVRTTDMTKSYYLRPVETAEAFTDDWFKTGDKGRIEDGHLIFMGEKKLTRKMKGNMVDLEEVRRALMMFPKVHEAEVECRENVISARIRIDSGNNFEDEIQAIKKNLEWTVARYKIPKMIERM